MRFSNRFLQRRWNDLQALAARLSPDHLQLLAGLNVPAARLGLPPIPELPESYSAPARILSEPPSFRNFSTEDALPLKAGLWASAELQAQSLAWVEKLMRFCEVRGAELESRARDKWAKVRERRRGLIELTVLFLECHRATGDLRFLSSALKLLDGRLGLPSLREETPAALLLLRAAVQAEAALRALEEAA